MTTNSSVPRVFIASMLAGLVLAVCPSCSRKKTLHVFIWSDYISEEVIHRFEEQYDCKVRQDIFDSNELMVAKLQSGGAGYDVLCPSHYFVPRMASAGMLLELDKSRLPNLVHLDRSFVDKFDRTTLDYSVPYFASYTGIGYVKSLAGDVGNSWSVLADPRFNGRITLLDDHSEIIGAAAKFLGYSPEQLDDPVDGDARMEKVVETALVWRENALKFDNEQYKNGLATGEFMVVMGYFSDLSQIVAENDDLALMLPEEGCMMSCDMLAISSQAKEVDLAYAFIDFVHNPSNAAENISWVRAYCPNADAVPLLDDEILSDKSIFVDPRTASKSDLMPSLSPEQEERHLKYWNRIRYNTASED